MSETVDSCLLGGLYLHGLGSSFSCWYCWVICYFLPFVCFCGFKEKMQTSKWQIKGQQNGHKSLISYDEIALSTLKFFKNEWCTLF